MIESLKHLINTLAAPTIFLPLVAIAFFLVLHFYRVVSKPVVSGLILLFAVCFYVVSLFDHNFRHIVAKPDNVPITIMLFLCGFCVWMALRQAAINDERMEKGLPPMEKDGSETIFVWPDLVYIEFLSAVIVGVILTVWSIDLKAPLEQPASPFKAPNPSKAPWYFLGLQEMLVYFDPWLAGVVFPSLIISGLISIPYMDLNPRGTGYYSFKQRKMAITIYLFGFLFLWVTLIMLGTFFRGPNWNFFGPYEYWDVHKVEPLVNINLSEIIYIKILGTGLPHHWFFREIWGLLLIGFYVFALPPILAKTVLKDFFAKMGFLRYNVFMMHFLMMMLLPIKMICRWAFNLKYFVAVTEFFFNI